MDIASEQVHHLCRLARLELAPEERDRLGADLTRILATMRALGETAAEGIDAPEALGLRDLRADDPAGGIGAERALREAPDHDGGWFRVPRVVALTLRDGRG